MDGKAILQAPQCQMILTVTACPSFLSVVVLYCIN